MLVLPSNTISATTTSSSNSIRSGRTFIRRRKRDSIDISMHTCLWGTWREVEGKIALSLQSGQEWPREWDQCKFLTFKRKLPLKTIISWDSLTFWINVMSIVLFITLIRNVNFRSRDAFFNVPLYVFFVAFIVFFFNAFFASTFMIIS